MRNLGNSENKNKQRFEAAAYIRLSREDGDREESDSIGNQKKLLADFIDGQEDLRLYDFYVDDGFSGTSFDRPAFRRMLEDLEHGTVNCVVVKDLSRFGRDYIDTGRYLERYFPELEVRFISVSDGIDSLKHSYDMLLPIKNVFNEQYARDISGKIHATLSAKQKAGEFIGAFPSYGYRKSPSDKNRLVIDEYAAGIVRRIFSLYLQGCGKQRIAALLNEEGILCPAEYKKAVGMNYRNPNRLPGMAHWSYSTVNSILHREMYAGLQESTRDSSAEVARADAAPGRFRYAPASIIKISNNKQHNFIIVDKGAEDGITPQSGIITEKGVIGIISAVSRHYSYAISFRNTGMTVSARIGRTGPVGSLTWDGKSTCGALLNEIPHHIGIEKGDTVYTRGLYGRPMVYKPSKKAILIGFLKINFLF